MVLYKKILFTEGRRETRKLKVLHGARRFERVGGRDPHGFTFGRCGADATDQVRGIEKRKDNIEGKVQRGEENDEGGVKVLFLGWSGYKKKD